MEGPYQNIPKMEKLSSAENQIEKPKIKEGVDFVFEQNPELVQVGTKEQYSEYLGTIFPESVIKDIVWHGSSREFDSFSKDEIGTNTESQRLTKLGFFFSDNMRVTQFYGKNVKGYILNFKDPIEVVDNYGNMITTAFGDIENEQKRKQEYDSIILRNFKDSIVEDDETKTTGQYHIKQNQFIALDSEQIYTLGSKSDMQKFQDFIGKEK